MLGKAGSPIIIAFEPPHVGELFGLVWKGWVIDDVPVEHIELVHLHQVQVGLQHRLCSVVSEAVSNKGRVFLFISDVKHLLVSRRTPRCAKRGESRT